MSARAGRSVSAYIWGNAYRLLTETTPEGNKNVFSVMLEKRNSYKTIMAGVLKKLPEKAAVIEPVIAQFATVFSTCQPSLDAAAAAITVEENSRAAIRLRTQCDT